MMTFEELHTFRELQLKVHLLKRKIKRLEQICGKNN